MIWGLSKIPTFSFAAHDHENLVHIYLQQSPSLSSAFTNCFMIPSLIWRSFSYFQERVSLNAFYTRCAFFLDKPILLYPECWDLTQLSHRNWKRRNFVQWKPLNRASVCRANRLFEEFRLKKNDPIFFLLQILRLLEQEHRLLEQLDVVTAV